MDKHAVIPLKKEGHLNRSLETMLGINRKTIDKYWNDYLSEDGLQPPFVLYNIETR